MRSLQTSVSIVRSISYPCLEIHRNGHELVRGRCRGPRLKPVSTVSQKFATPEVIGPQPALRLDQVEEAAIETESIEIQEHRRSGRRFSVNIGVTRRPDDRIRNEIVCAEEYSACCSREIVTLYGWPLSATVMPLKPHPL